jgi:outer membrane protein
MRNLKTLLLIAVIAVGFNTMQAQSNVAHIDLGAIIKLMPETIKMNEDLEKLSKTYQDDLKEKEDSLKALTDRYTVEAEAQTDEENQKRAQEIQQEDYKIKLGYQMAEQDIQKQGNEMMEPIILKARNAVLEVSKELNFDYILDKNSLIVAEGTDISIMVKTKLGL